MTVNDILYEYATSEYIYTIQMSDKGLQDTANTTSK